MPPRTLYRLSPVKVKRLKAKGMHADGGGLYLRVGPTGGRSWVFRWFENGRTRDHGLGPAHTINLTEAREAALECRKLRLQGVSPVAHKAAALAARKASDAKALTFRQCADAYIASHEAGWGSRSHRSQWTNTLSQHVHPVIGELPVAEIDTAAVMRAIGPIWQSIPETASRVRGRIEVVLDWARVSGYRSGDNPARWRGNLDHLLPARAKVQKVTHLAAIPYAEIGDFMKLLGTKPADRALRFLILTACRSGEVLGAVSSEIDFAAKTWTIPAERMKAGRAHRVPLTDAALALLDSGDPLFGRRMGSKVLGRVLRKVGRGDITTHGFRSAFRDWAAEATNFPSEVAEMALAHAVGSAVEAAYRRGDLIEKRRLLMESWADYCTNPKPKGASVVPMTTRRR